MPYNGSGTYAAPASTWNPAVDNTDIDSGDWNSLLDDLETALSTCLLKDGTQTPTANIPMGGFKLTGLAAGTASGNSLRYEQVNGVVTTLGDLLVASASGTFTRQAVGANGTALVYDSNQTAGVKGAYPAIRSYLSGCGLSTAGNSATMSIAAGSATDSTNVDMMVLAAIAKTTSAWAVGTGNGGLDTSSIANNTWYHFYVIKRVDTGVVDVLFSTSATSPTMPANYTLKRRIGSGLTNGSAQWVAFTQDGDLFQWAASVLDVSAVSISATTASSYTLTSTPLGVNVIALFRSTFAQGATTNSFFLWTDLATNDEAASSDNASTHSLNAGDTITSTVLQVRTNTSSQIRGRCTAANGTINARTYGWIDRRGRDS